MKQHEETLDDWWPQTVTIMKNKNKTTTMKDLEVYKNIFSNLSLGYKHLNSIGY